MIDQKKCIEMLTSDKEYKTMEISATVYGTHLELGQNFMIHY